MAAPRKLATRAISPCTSTPTPGLGLPASWPTTSDRRPAWLRRGARAVLPGRDGTLEHRKGSRERRGGARLAVATAGAKRLPGRIVRPAGIRALRKTDAYIGCCARPSMTAAFACWVEIARNMRGSPTTRNRAILASRGARRSRPSTRDQLSGGLVRPLCRTSALLGQSRPLEEPSTATPAPPLTEHRSAVPP